MGGGGKAVGFADRGACPPQAELVYGIACVSVSMVDNFVWLMYTFFIYYYGRKKS